MIDVSGFKVNGRRQGRFGSGSRLQLLKTRGKTLTLVLSPEDSEKVVSEFGMRVTAMYEPGFKTLVLVAGDRRSLFFAGNSKRARVALGSMTGEYMSAYGEADSKQLETHWDEDENGNPVFVMEVVA